MRKRGGGIQRKTGGRKPRKRCFIFCEGERTEPDYLRAFKSRFPQCLFDVISIGAAGVPKTLLEKARDKKKQIEKDITRGRGFAENDEVWIAFDKDEHPEVQATINGASIAGVGVAFSNPCFELWLILHQAEFDRPDDRHKVQKHCDDIVECYNRRAGKTGDFLPLLENLDKAEARAEAQCQRRIDEDAEFGAPSTSFYLLTRKLRST